MTKIILVSIQYSIAVLCVCAISATAIASSSTYHKNKEVKAFIKQLVEEDSFNARYLKKVFAQVERKQSIIDAISKPAERTFTWGQYRKLFLGKKRIELGVDFIRENRDVFVDIEQKTDIPAHIISAIIGVETKYGRIMGNYRVMDALTTLAFDFPRRAKFFRNELRHFLIITNSQQKDPLSFVGSYAGAMGYGQFMPSSYRSYAVDYDNDNFIDLWGNEKDAIASVANYLKKHGWESSSYIAIKIEEDSDLNVDMADAKLKPKRNYMQLNKEIGNLPLVDENLYGKLVSLMHLEADDGSEFWLGFPNFYTITRYNRSKLYAMAVLQLAIAIEQRYSELYNK